MRKIKMRKIGSLVCDLNNINNTYVITNISKTTIPTIVTLRAIQVNNENSITIGDVDVYRPWSVIIDFPFSIKMCNNEFYFYHIFPDESILH